MKMMLRVAVLIWMALFLSSPCQAMRLVGVITKQEAKEMGVVVRATPSGPEAAWLELEFKPEGKLKSYQHMELEIREGEKTLVAYAALEATRSASGSIVVRFMANRAFLDKLVLVIVTGFPSAYANNEIRVKEFIDPDKIR